MLHENNPGLQQIKEALINGKMEAEKPSISEQANADYWRLFYTIQEPLMETKCGNMSNKIHEIAKRVYKRWKERKD